MKIRDVRVGQHVWTRVSGYPVKVSIRRVVESRTRSGRLVRRVEVARVDNGKVLPKARSASALHLTSGPWDTEPRATSQDVAAEHRRQMTVSNMDRPDNSGRHPVYKHLVLFEIEPHYGSYILTAVGHDGDALITADEAMDMFGKDFEDEFGYLSDEYLDVLEQRR